MNVSLFDVVEVRIEENRDSSPLQTKVEKTDSSSLQQKQQIGSAFLCKQIAANKDSSPLQTKSGNKDICPLQTETRNKDCSPKKQ